MSAPSIKPRRSLPCPLRSAVSVIAVVVALVAPAASVAATVPAATLGVVAVSGPTNLPPLQDEVQRLTVTASAGSYALTPATGRGTGTLAPPALALGNLVEGSTEVALVAVVSGSFAVGQVVEASGLAPGTTVTAVGPGTLTLSAPATVTESFALLSSGSSEVTGISAGWGEFHVGDSISGPGIPPGTTIVAIGSGTLSLSASATEGGTKGFTTSETSAPIASDAPATGPGSVEGILHALPGAGGIRVAEGLDGIAGERTYFLTFDGSLKFTDVPRTEADGASLEGSHPEAIVTTRVPGGPGTGEIGVYLENLGGLPSVGPTTVVVDLPAGIITESAPEGEGKWTCGGSGAGVSVVTCETAEPLQPATPTEVSLRIPVEVTQPAAGSFDVRVEASSAAAGAASTDLPVTVSQSSAKPGVRTFVAGVYGADGNPDSTAAAHPFAAITSFFLNTVRSPLGGIIPAGDPKDIDVALPPGLLGNPLATPRCPASVGVVKGSLDCEQDAIVGTAAALVGGDLAAGSTAVYPVFNMEPPTGSPAQFRFLAGAGTVTINLDGALRSDGDYGITVESPNTPQLSPVKGAFFTFWGDPGASIHDPQRCRQIPGQGECASSTAGEVAFLTNPSDCAEEAAEPPVMRLAANSWQVATFDERSTNLPPVSGCDGLAGRFNPAFTFRPTAQEAAAPIGATARLSIPQEGLLEPEGRAAPELKKAVVALPRGVDVNPAAANGMETCSEAQMGLLTIEGAAPNPIRFDKNEPSCPEASKLGTVEVESPLIDERLAGTIYLAAQDENPFHTLLAIYAVIDSPKNGVLVKLPGEVKPDPITGQLAVTFDDNPQLPVESLTLNFRGGGPRSPLASPETCGSFTTHGELTPWSAPESGPPAQTEDSFAITGGPGGGSCATTPAGQPFDPGFEAGTLSTTAGAFAPLLIKVARKDGEQELKSLDFTLPKGLTGRLAGISYCPEASIRAAEGKSGREEQAAASCPSQSQIGSVETAAGVGTEPIRVGGKVYLAGPYKGAPLSSVVVTPAVAGPFDLGDVVVRAPLFVDPETTQITAKSDPVPTILKGIPLKLRSIAIVLDRRDFTLNPTSCEPMSATASLTGSSGGDANPANRFQVGGCDKLRFKPKIKITLKGSTKHAGHPALKAVLTYPKEGAYANIARAQVNLPHSEFLDQSNLNKTCTRPVLLEEKCPAKSIYGRAKAWTPLLEQPLEGPVYLVGGYGYKLPALVADLNGQIRVVLKARVDSGPNKGIRSTFEAVPDAPVSRFVLELKGGPKYSLLENSEDLCRKPQRAIARFTAQNGLVQELKPLIADQCGKAKGKRKRKR
jgi:hypothetical protein